MSPPTDTINRCDRSPHDAACDHLGFLAMKSSMLNLNGSQTNADSNVARSANTNGGTDVVAAAAGVEVQATWNNEGEDPETGVDEPPAPVHAPENPHYWDWAGRRKAGRRNWSTKEKFVAAAAVLGIMSAGGSAVNRKMKASQNQTAMVMMPKTPKTTKASKRPKAPSCLFPSESPSETLTLQRKSLIALYDATDGANWDDNEGWLVDPDECTWFGVTCTSGIVTELDLGDNNLDGTIPCQIASLSQLGKNGYFAEILAFISCSFLCN